MRLSVWGLGILLLSAGCDLDGGECLPSIEGEFLVTETPVSTNPVLCGGSASVGSWAMTLPVIQNPISHECLGVTPEILTVRPVVPGIELQCVSSLFFDVGRPDTPFVMASWIEYERCYPTDIEVDPQSPPSLRCEYRGSIVRIADE